MNRHRTTRAAAVLVGAVAVAGWAFALAPAHAQLAEPEVLSLPPVDTSPVEEVLDPVTPVIDDAIDTVNDTIDMVERTVDETLGRLPELPVDLPTVDLPRVPDPVGDPPAMPPAATPPSPDGAVSSPPGGSPASPSRDEQFVGSPPTAGSDTAFDHGEPPANPGSGLGDGASDGRGERGRRLASRTIANRGDLGPEEFLDPIAADGLPRGLVLAAAALLTLVSLALAWTAHTDARGALALVERLQAPVPVRV